MGLTDRQAADLRKEDAVSKASQTLTRHTHSNRQQSGLGFHNGLTEAVRELRKDLVEVYAELDGAGEEPLRAELVKVIGDRLSAFIQSSVAGVRGFHALAAAREGEQLKAVSTMGIGRDLDLAVHARTKRKAPSAAPAPPAAPARLKQDKFGILDSPKQYDLDFKPSVGLLGVSVIYFDLDDFKKLNTSFTEPVIDRTLLPKLQRLIAALVVHRGYAYAEGGDEFIIMLPNTNTALAEAFATVLLERIRSTTFMVEADTVNVTASAGIASSMNADDAQVCREGASAAKREAKQQGKDRCVISTMHRT
jgi:diguanylate cyclase (GGDEF)-like protein